MALNIGERAPDFTLVDGKRETYTLDSFPGQKLILAFYRLAFTGGWTTEMSAFRDKLYLFEEAGAQVVGISVDSFAAAGEYQDKLSTGFPLLSDFPRNQAGRDYGTYDEELGVNRRTTIVLDEDRIVRDIYDEPSDFESHPTHALEVLAALRR